MRNLLIKFAFLILLLSSTILLVEGGLRLLGVTSDAVDPLYERNTKFGVFHVPHASRWEKPARTDAYAPVKVTINSFGLRDREYPNKEKPRGVFRILLMGDSFIEARQVELPQAAGKQLEKFLNQKAGRKFEVVQVGVSGWSPSHYYAYLRNEGLAWKPDLVVTTFDASDVYDDNAWKPAMIPDADGLPVSFRIPQDTSWKEWLVRHSRVRQLIRQVVRQYQTRRRAALQPAPKRTKQYPIFNEKYSGEDERLWADSKRYLLGTRRLTRAHGIPFLLVYIPLGNQVSKDEWVTGKVALGYPADSLLTSTKPEEVLQGFCRKNDILFFDTLPAFKQFKAAHPNIKLFVDWDAHWTEAGNELVAKAIYDFLENDSLLVRARLPRERA